MALRWRAANVTGNPLSERPNTSSGPVSKSFEKPSFDKRVSRDDLALTLKSQMRGNVLAHHIPVRGRLPSPETSPKTESLTRTTVVRMATPESLGEGDAAPIAIGMALGSPSQDVDFPPTSWKGTRTMTTTNEIPQPPEDLQSRPKARKWGLFGRSKSKRGRPENATQRSMTEPPRASNASITSSKGSMAGFHRHGQMDPEAKKMHKHKPFVTRSQTEPVMAKQHEDWEARMSRKNSTKSARGELKTQGPEILLPPTVPPVPQLIGPFLDVEIPSVKMERYSIMFGNVLKQPNQASSLLARRQATLDRLKTINDQITQERGAELPRPRRATSPQPRASPAFSLFPTSSGGPKSSSTPQGPSPRLRSSTSPAMMHSPAKAVFEEVSMPLTARAMQVKQPHRDSKVIPRPRQPGQLVSRFSKQPAPRQLPSRLSPIKQPSPFTPDTSSLTTESPENTDDEDDELHIRDQLRPVVPEPDWQMVTPLAPAPSSSPKPTRKPATIAPVTPPDPTPNKPAEAEVDPDEALQNAVEISIARQISVSRQQRKMLLPLQELSRRKRNMSHPGQPTVDSAVSVGEDERLSETKTATPIIVHPGKLGDDPRIKHVHRKSERAILEGP